MSRTGTTNGIPTPSSRGGALAVWLTPGRFAVLLAILVFATFPGVLLGKTTFVVRDFGLFSYPVAFFHRQSFWRGALPLWNPLNGCGLPFLAQWNTMTLYPPALIYLVFPLTWSLPFFCLAHLFWGGLGMYILAQRWTHCRLAAALAGVVFSFNGLSLNCLIWPSTIASLSWLPWVVALTQAAWRQRRGQLVLATLAGALQMLAGGAEVIQLTWLLLVVLACSDLLLYPSLRARIAWRFPAMVLLVALVCAAQLLPFLQLVIHSQRGAGYGSADWPMPLWGWANFLVPLFRTAPTEQGWFQQIGQYWTTSYYAGMVTLFLAAVALRRLRQPRICLSALLLGFSLLLALGEQGWLYRAAHACFPWLGFIRYPVKFVILAVALLPLLAAFGLRWLLRQKRSLGRWEIGCAVGLLLLIGGIVWLGREFPLPGTVWRATWQSGLSRAVFLLAVVLTLALLLKARGPGRVLPGCFLLVVVWLDLLTHMPAQNPGVNPSVYEPGWASAQLGWQHGPKRGQSRVMLAPKAQQVLRNRLLPDPAANYLMNRLAFFADCNLLEGVPQIYSLFPLLPREAYRVSMLPYVQISRSFPALLDFMAVSHTTAPGTTYEWQRRPSAMPLVTAGQEPVFAEDEAAFGAFWQTNLDLREVVFLPLAARQAVSAKRQTAARVLATKFGSQRISLETEAPAASLVVISQSFYPAWKARLDGAPAHLWRANYAFQALQVPAGHHRVELVYRDTAFLAGVLLSALALTSCLALTLTARFRTKRTAEAKSVF